jgi:hypothetical protein
MNVNKKKYNWGIVGMLLLKLIRISYPVVLILTSRTPKIEKSNFYEDLNALIDLKETTD